MTSYDDIYIYTIVNRYVSIVTLEDEFSHISILFQSFGLQQYTSSIVQKTSSFILLIFSSTIEI